MTTDLLHNLRQWIAEGGNSYKQYYHTTDWVSVRAEVMRLYHGECIRCRSLGRSPAQSQAVILHHVKHVKKYPELADSLYFDPEYEMLEQFFSGRKYGEDVLIANNGKLILLRPVDFKCELFVDVDSHKAIQLLPLCRNCHRIVHMGAGAVINEKYPERW